MTQSRPTAAMASRALRADAQRNRDTILLAARDTFEAEGVLASLDGIALRAGVGNATLYRNFPRRRTFGNQSSGCVYPVTTRGLGPVEGRVGAGQQLLQVGTGMKLLVGQADRNGDP